MKVILRNVQPIFRLKFIFCLFFILGFFSPTNSFSYAPKCSENQQGGACFVTILCDDGETTLKCESEGVQHDCSTQEDPPLVRYAGPCGELGIFNNPSTPVSNPFETEAVFPDLTNQYIQYWPGPTGLKFDGVNDYIQTSSPVLDGIADGDFTFEAWVNGDESFPMSHPVVFTNRTSISDGATFFFHDVWGGSLSKMLAMRIGNYNYLLINNGTYNGSLLDGIDHHVSITRKGNILSFYADGNLLGTRALLNNPNIATSRNLRIGADTISGLPFRGDISDVRIWSVARTDAEIMTNFHNRLAWNTPNLIANLEMNESSGQMVVEKVSNTRATLGSIVGVDAQDPIWTAELVNNTPGCLDPVRHVIKKGVADNFAMGGLDDGPVLAGVIPSAATPGTNISSWVGMNHVSESVGFDSGLINRFFAHTFSGLPSNIVEARLEIGLKSINGSIAANDSIGLQTEVPVVAGSHFLWGNQISQLPINHLSTVFAGSSNPEVVTLNLTRLPIGNPAGTPLGSDVPSGGFFTGMINSMNSRGELDVLIEDDTAVDYIQLTIATCNTPVANDDIVSIEANSTTTILSGLTANDLEVGGAPWLSGIASVDTTDIFDVTAGTLTDTVGTVSVSTGVVYYTPAWGFTGTDVFIYYIHGAGGVSAATVTVNVVDTTPPIVDAGADVTIDATGPDGAVYDLAGQISVSDFCFISTLTSPAGTYPIGSTLVTVTVTDCSGNTASDQVVVTVRPVPPHAVDLVVTAVSSASSLMAGSTVTISNTVRNQGNLPTTTSFTRMGIYLSTDNIITTADIHIGGRRTYLLAAGASSTANTSVNLPATLTPGTYYLGAIADRSNLQPESDETNNALSGAMITVVAAPPQVVDLVVTAVNSAPSLIAGSTVTISNTVRNQGNLPTTTSFTRMGIYLSTDNIITTADIHIGGRRTYLLAAGASSTANTSVNLPATLTPGTYYLGAIADRSNLQPESDETNNALSGAMITVVAAPPQVVDLVVTAVNSAPSLMAGSTVTISNTVRNQGNLPTTTSFTRMGIYLSTDNIITTADIHIGGRRTYLLAAGASSTANTSVNLPATLTPGTYYLGAIADRSNLQPESDETNNALSGAMITVVAAPPQGVDLVMTAVNTTATSLPIGGKITISNTVRNQGNLRTTKSFTRMGIYLSTDNIITTADIQIGGRRVYALAAGASSTTNTNVRIPASLPAGTYYLGAIADRTNMQPESNESNNSLTGVAIGTAP